MSKRAKILLHVVILGVIFLIGAGPWILVAIGGSVASANGCQLDESGAHPCIINGKDYGDTLYSLGLMGWIGIATCPLGLLLLGAYFVALIVMWAMNRNKASKTTT